MTNPDIPRFCPIVGGPLHQELLEMPLDRHSFVTEELHAEFRGASDIDPASIPDSMPPILRTTYVRKLVTVQPRGAGVVIRLWVWVPEQAADIEIQRRLEKAFTAFWAALGMMA